ncbi:MAG: oligosaccharide flippase family protein, partial [Pseudomonadales bacterium]|nr:oligosaccharide flippase family protein [Pseudomonadales bacterium]
MAIRLPEYWRSRFARDVLYTTSAKFLTTLIRFGLRVFLLRILTKDDFGAIAALSALALYFDLLAEFSSGPVVQKHLVSDKSDPLRISRHVKLLLLSRTATSLVSALLFLAASYAMGYIGNGIAIAFLTANVLIGAIAVAPDVLMQSTDRFRAFSIINVVVVTITTLASMVIIYHFRTIDGFFAGLALSTLVSLGCRFLFVRQSYEIDWCVSVPLREVLELLRSAAP